MGLFFPFLARGEGGFSLMNGFEQALHFHFSFTQLRDGEEQIFRYIAIPSNLSDAFLISESENLSRPHRPVFGDSMCDICE